MFTIIQSHRTEYLVDQLLIAYQSKDQPLFEEFVVIVPSMVLGDWLDKTIASRAGISTLVTTKFWGQYQWTLMQEVLAKHNTWLAAQATDEALLNVPEVAVLSSTVMQWRLFGYLTLYRQSIIEDTSHPLHPLLESLLGADSDEQQQEARLWQLAADLARVFSRYLTHRDNWLDRWSKDEAIDVEAMINEKDALSGRFDKFATITPSWLREHYIELEAAQRHLWYSLFSGVHQHRVAIEQRFWQVLENNRANERDVLPKSLRIFTIQQLPQNELDFLQRLSRFMHITLLHYNPSQLFWADIVDKVWLQRQKIINPDSVFLRDHGHALLSRLGKQSRETFAMLAALSGNEFYDDMVVDWQDRFTEAENDDYQLTGLDQHEHHDSSNVTLLARLQHDVLMLDETATQQATVGRLSQALDEQLQFNSDDSEEQQWHSDAVLQQKRFVKHREWQLSAQDNSLSIHSCHSLQRQLEILRGMIGRWLNEPNPDGSRRHVSDIVVLLPDVERHHALINSIFVDGKGQDGLTLPAKVTGVVDTSIRQLWEAISGFYRLLGSDSARFEAPEVLDWLMLPPLYESFGLTHEQMSRGCELLIQAGFVRGFDEAHLQHSLDTHDYDYRFSFAHALDRLAMGLIMPEAKVNASLYPLHWPENMLAEKTLPLPGVGLDDAPLVEALCRIYQGLDARRDDHKLRLQAEQWLKQIETQVIHTYFASVDQTRSMRAIYQAMNGFKSSLRANRHYQQYRSHHYANEEGGYQASNKRPISMDAHELEQRLSKVERLPLKLNFMLDSIEDELESQQVSAEPTGVITFGRFGALRNVPFGLVVMLNMNLSEFPNRDRDNRYDLMKAGIAQRGDRFSEDDDNGAFLDALLCARSACWIFYNGQSLTDTHEHLPANPVSELLQFLQGEVKWQWQHADMDKGRQTDADVVNAEKVQRYLPSLVERWLVTHHPALPFSRDLFEVDSQIFVDRADSELIENDSKDSLKSNGNANGSVDTSKNSSADQADESWRRPLDKAMQRIKYQQRLQYPPAEIWQSVFTELNQRANLQTHNHRTQKLAQDNDSIIAPSLTPKLAQTVTMPSMTDYQLLAKLLTAQRISKQQLKDVAALLGNNITNLSDAELAETLREGIFAIEQIDIQSLSWQVRHPAKQFLREQQVLITQGEEMLSRQEPLALDNLTRYQINDELLKQLHRQASKQPSKNNHDNPGVFSIDDLQVLLYKDVMPAGVARHTTLTHQLTLIESQCQAFKTQLERHNIEFASIGPVDEASEESAEAEQAMSLLTPTQEVATDVDLSALFQTLSEQTLSSASLSESSNSTSNATAVTLSAIRDWLPNKISIKGSIPSIDCSAEEARPDAMEKGHNNIWLNILPNSARGEHLLRFWLSHLYWQVARHTTAEQVNANDGQSIWCFNKNGLDINGFKGKSIFILEPLVYEEAVIELLKWAVFAKLAGQIPMTLLPKHALTYLDNMRKNNELGESSSEVKPYYPKRHEFSDWLTPDYHADTVYDSCAQHPLWQYLLNGQDAFACLSNSLKTLAVPMYQPMLQALKPLAD